VTRIEGASLGKWPLILCEKNEIDSLGTEV
jgi:hypothetical protein